MCYGGVSNDTKLDACLIWKNHATGNIFQQIIFLPYEIKNNRQHNKIKTIISF